MPQASQSVEKNKSYGRQIPEIKPEENRAKIQGQRREEKTGRGRSKARRQEEVTNGCWLPLRE
jgi:hypothetical protein